SWRLRVDEVRLPDGATMERGVVEHPGAVVLMPLVAGEAGYQIVMLRQYRAAIGATILELPAGTRGWGEDWLVCAQRELREETGYRADSFMSLGQIWPAPGGSDELMTLYVATGLTPDPLPMDVDEEIEVVAMALDEVVAMALDGRLQDGKSVVGILRTAHHLQL
ncbi:MAG: NUDIX hydrolase, partial [Ardenticatenaceae bacterium]|nr:NUDIX hydrolase [Ardenticatenaceae bacterium]